MLFRRSSSILSPSIIVALCLLETSKAICDRAIEDALSIGDLAEGDALLRSRARGGKFDEEDENSRLPRDCGRIPIQGRLGLRNSLEEFAEDARKLPIYRIVGGRDAKIGEFPPFVHIRTSNNLIEKDCGGAILSKDYVITTASCLPANVKSARVYPTFYRPKAIRLARKSGRQEIKPRWYTSTTFCRSSRYSATIQEGGWKKLEYDFALIKLNQSIEFNDYVQPACLPDRSLEKFRPAYSVYLGVMGANYEQPNILQVSPVKRVECPADHRQYSHICLQTPDPDKYAGSSCHGKFVSLVGMPTSEYDSPSNKQSISFKMSVNSGSPTLTDIDGRLYLFGLNSYGANECESNLDEIAVNTSVFSVTELIINLIKSCN